MRPAPQRAALYIATLLLTLCAGAIALHAQSYGRAGSSELVAYNGRFTFSRVRYAGPGFGGRGGAAWAHDYPQADLNLPAVLAEISAVRPNLGRSNVLDLEDDAIFSNPILYISEPGYWSISEQGAHNLRAYLLKGGFLIADDFEAEQWHNFAAQFQRALPEYTFIEITASHPVFHAFFGIAELNTPHPLVRVEPVYYGVFEGNNPAGRMLAIINYNNDLAEYWEHSGTGFFAMDPTNGAFKLGINYVVYALTH